MGIASLDAALSGLRASQRQMSVLSANIANASTPGYTRKILPLESQAVEGVTVGVLSGAAVRRVDLNLERELWTQVAAVAELDIQQTYLSRVQQFHGPPDKELSIASELSRLKDSFALLSDSPSDSFLLSSTINQATSVAGKINDLSDLISDLRNDAQNEMQGTVLRINDLLDQIANLNMQVSKRQNTNLSSADIEDKRDEAIKELSGLIDISFFVRGDGVMVVQTTRGVELADTRVPRKLEFDPTPISALTYYPASVSPVYVGDPLTDPAATDITAQDIGGKLGGLINLRDTIFPKQMAQLDEVAHKLALRFDAQGLRLFTDSTGGIPLDTPPDTTTPTPVEYVGFSAIIQVNDAILNDSSFLQRGTYGATIATGSNEVIRRAIQFAFGDVNYQEAIGSIDMRVSANAPPNNTLQEFLGITSSNTVSGTRDLSAFTDPATFIAAANGTYAATTDTFRMTFRDTNLGLGPVNVDVDLGLVPDTAGNLTQDIIAYITGTVIPALPALDQTALTNMGVTFTEGTNGQLDIFSTGRIDIDATAVGNAMGTTGLAYLGFAEGTYNPTDPYFDIQVGNNAPTRITIDSNDTQVQLQAKLLAVPGLAMEDLTTSTDGFLRLRPGNSYTNPDFGGDLRIIAGPYTATSAGANAVFGPGTIADGVNIVSALFGSFSTGPLQDVPPISNVGYQSQVSTTDTSTVDFRSEFLGPGADASTRILGARRIIDFAQKIVNEQSQEASIIEVRKSDEKSLQDLFEKQLLSDSGVNIDEELGNLIQVQNAYAASARVVTAVSDMFERLLQAVL